MTRGTRVLASLLLVLALASGCMASKETRQGANHLEDAIGTPDWAAAVTVRSGLDGQLADEVSTVVVLDGSATPADVAAFVEGFPARVVDAGLEDTAANEQLTFISATGAHLEIHWGEVVPDEVARGVTEWFGVATALGPAVDGTARTDGGATYVVSLPDGDRRRVATTYGQLTDLAEPDTAWQLDATDGGLVLEFSAAVLPTQDQLAVWTRLLASLDGLPDDLPPSEVSLHLLDRTVAEVTVVAPDDTTTESFTMEAYGGRVWRVVRPQLDAMKTLPGAWSYFANWAPSYAPTSRNIFISLLSDRPTIDNADESTRWSQAAKDYVDRVER